MFGRKKAIRKKPALTLWDGVGGVLYSGDLTGMSVPDGLVVALSAEYFNDPTPCEIHRSAVLSRVFLAIEDALPSGNAASIGALEPDIRRLFSAYPDAQRALLGDHGL